MTKKRENKIYLNKNHLDQIQKFLRDFNADYFCIRSCSESGIGSIISVVIDVGVNGHEVTVNKIISDVEDW